VSCIPSCEWWHAHTDNVWRSQQTWLLGCLDETTLPSGETHYWTYCCAQRDQIPFQFASQEGP
jgi:hypothetical protein